MAFVLSLPKCTINFFSLKQSMPVVFNVLDGKTVNDTLLTGQLIALSKKGALLQMSAAGPIKLSALNNLKLNFLRSEVLGLEKTSEDVYAKVIEQKDEREQGVFQLRFTAKPPAIAAQLDRLYQLISQIN